MWRRKRYDRYNLVIAEVWSRRPDVHFVYVGTKTDDFHGRPRTRALDLRGVGNLSHQCSILGCADVLVANDGGLAHVGAAIGVPTYVLFGPTVRKKNLPPTASLIETTATVDCMPCQYTRAKPGGRHPAFICDHRCMTTIDPAIVAESILNELQEQGK
jgi:ADP-heptose:LPS heptosyltransferase